MTQRFYKDESRKNWYREDAILDAEIKLGAILRIADATEAMAKNYTALIAERDRLKRWYESEQARCQLLNRSNAALRGCLKRAKASERTKS